MQGEGLCQTAVPGLALYRSSSLSSHDATVNEPSLCAIAQEAKEVLLTKITRVAAAFAVFAILGAVRQVWMGFRFDALGKLMGSLRQ
jgi:hypothetical protein